MKPALSATLSSLFFVLSACSQPAESAAQEGSTAEIPEGYKLVFSDEFNKDGALDSSKWGFDVRRNKERWGSALEYNSKDRLKNARVEDGRLVIEVHKEMLADMPDWGGQEYTSARVTTKDKKGWTYGFYDIRAKLPCGKGMWPQIWLLTAPPTWQWPDHGEIDIMEMVGWDPEVVHVNIHTKVTERDKKWPGKSFKIPGACTEFHNYQVDWQPERLVFMVDNKPYHTLERNGADYDSWPFDHDFYLILNLTIGGTWGGQKGIDEAALPQKMEIDYVRVYQKTP